MSRELREKFTYTAREDFVIVRVEKRERLYGLHMPEASVEGNRYIVHSVGPLVQRLSVGDEVLLLGSVGEEWGYLPGRKDLIVTKQSYIPLTMTEAGE